MAAEDIYCYNCGRSRGHFEWCPVVYVEPKKHWWNRFRRSK